MCSLWTKRQEDLKVAICRVFWFEWKMSFLAHIHKHLVPSCCHCLCKLWNFAYLNVRSFTLLPVCYLGFLCDKMWMTNFLLQSAFLFIMASSGTTDPKKLIFYWLLWVIIFYHGNQKVANTTGKMKHVNLYLLTK